MLADLSPAALKERNKLLARGSGGSENESVSRTGSSSSLASLPTLVATPFQETALWPAGPDACSTPPQSMLVPAGWALLLAIWVGLAAALRNSEEASPSLEVAFSGWTAVVATAIGGLPLLLARPERIPGRLIGAANAVAAGMMVGAGAGMLLGLWEERQSTGSLTPLAGIAAGALSVSMVGSMAATPAGGAPNRVAMVVLAFAADAFAEGLALASAHGGGRTVNLLVTAALIVHNLPEGLAVAAPLTLKHDGRLSPAAACLLAGCTSLPQPLVGLAAHHLLQAGIHPLVPCALTAASVGAVVWVGVADLFVEAAESLGRIGALAVVVPTTGLMLVYHALTEV